MGNGGVVVRNPGCGQQECVRKAETSGTFIPNDGGAADVRYFCLSHSYQIEDLTVTLDSGRTYAIKWKRLLVCPTCRATHDRDDPYCSDECADEFRRLLSQSDGAENGPVRSGSSSADG